MPRYIEQLNECTDPASGDMLWLVDASAPATDKDRRVDVAKFLLLDSSGRAPTMHIYRTVGGGVWPLKIEGVTYSQPAIEFVDGAPTPNRWLIGSGRTINDGTFFLYDIRQNAHRLSVNTAGVVMINNLAGSSNRAVYSDPNGNLTNTASDERLKTDIEAITPDEALGIVEALTPVRYNWRDTDERGTQREMGLIAQQVEAVAPEVIGANEDGMLSLDYAKLVSVLAGAVQALSARVAELECKQ
jgi:hypothetical protein